MKCNRTLHDEFRHGTASAPEHAGSVFLRFCCSVPPSPRHHAFCLIWYGGGGRGRVSPKGETDGILVPIRWTRFCQTIFWGYGFGKTETAFPARIHPPDPFLRAGFGIRFRRESLGRASRVPHFSFSKTV